MRKLLALVIVLVVAALALPYGMGMMAQKQLTRLVNHLNDESPNVNITLNDYHRGWLRSSAKVAVDVVEPSDSGKADKDLSVSFNESITHGPILFTKDGIKFGQAQVTSDVVLSSEVQSKINAFFADQAQKPKVQSDILIKLGGGIVHTFDVPVFNYVHKDKKGEMSWKGLQGKWKIASDMKRIDGHMNFAGFVLDTPTVDITLANVLFKFRQKEALQGLWTGNGEFKLPMLKVEDKGQEKFLLTDFNGSSDSDISNGLLTASLDLQLGKLAVNNVSYGPGTFVSSLKNIDAETLQKLMEKAKQLNQPGIDNNQRQMMMFSLMPMIPTLLDKGAEYEIKELTFQFPEGKLDISGYARLLEASKVPGAGPLPQGFKERLDAELNLQVPTALAKKIMLETATKRMQKQQAMQAMIAKQVQNAQQQNGGANGQQAAASEFKPMTLDQIKEAAAKNAEQQLGLWVSKGMLTQEGDIYKVKFAFKDGKMTINGQTPNIALQSNAKPKAVTR